MVKLQGSRFLIYHYGYEVENEIFWRGLEGWEGRSLSIWTKLCETSDVGANTGIYALIAKSVNPQSKVFAYEPVKRVYDRLVHNINKNKFDIRAEEVALSDSDGHATIYDQPTEHIYSVTVNENLAAHDTAVIPVTIKTKKLATVIREEKLSKIDLMKIDVETHEAEVLEGMGEYLKLFKPTLLIEILTHKVAERVNHMLNGSGYIYYNIDELSGLEKVNEIAPLTTNGYNYLLIHTSKQNLLATVA